MDQQQYKPLAKLSREEIRVLGALIEKSRATPEYYPMTINSLTAACNQKTSRNPVVSYDESTVTGSLDSLKKKGLVSTVVGGSSRVTKYKHNLGIVYPLVPADLAILCLLMLRGPMTPGEINNASGRLYDFDSLDDIQQILSRLASQGGEGEPAFVRQLSRRPGQKETRYGHLWAGADDLEADNKDEEQQQAGDNSVAYRVTQLEQELAKLRAEFDDLIKQLT